MIMNTEQYQALQARIDADCDRVSAGVAHERGKRAATKKPHKVSWKKFVEMETCKP
jgi:hypothetical protein